MGHWFLIVIIVPNGLVKQLMHCVKVAIKKALKHLIDELLGNSERRWARCYFSGGNYLLSLFFI